MRHSMFIGRFQPFHDGHRWLIEQRLKLGKKVCIAVMDIHDTEPEKNPYKTEEVLLNIHDKLKHKPPENIKKISATKIREKRLV